MSARYNLLDVSVVKDDKEIAVNAASLEQRKELPLAVVSTFAVTGYNHKTKSTNKSQQLTITINRVWVSELGKARVNNVNMSV